ncbi:MAG: ribonuclease protein component [Clostridia bacterium]|nr:ribonuclease protein component [Clostridia bacterium]
MYRFGQKVYGNLLKIYICTNHLDTTRFGFSISKKVGKAVKRNLLKRRLREICRQNYHLFKKGYDIVIVAGKNSPEVSFSELEKQVLKLAQIGKILVKYGSDSSD